MKNLSATDIVELIDCQRSLQQTLNKLDRLNAGIAAIHVDAAIMQLRDNLERVQVDVAQGFDKDLHTIPVVSDSIN